MSKNIGIKAISNACGILPHTIRIWEKRYRAFTPQRTPGGQRIYDEVDLKRAKLMAMLLDDGHMISQLANLSLEQLHEMASIETTSEKIQTNMAINIGLKRIHKYLEQYEIDFIKSELQYLRMNHGAKDFVFHVTLPILRDIGLMVAKGKYSITQEHIVSTVIREQLSMLNLPDVTRSQNKIALATPEGNLHELSVIIADILCRANRVSTSYLGAAHPAFSLCEGVNAMGCSTIVLGVVSSDHWDYEKNIIPYLQEVDHHLNRKVNVILGGGWEIKFPKFKNILNVEVMSNFEQFDDLMAISYAA